MAVANNAYPADVRVRNEARALVAAGYVVTVVAPRAEAQLGAETLDGVNVLRYRLHTFAGGKLGYLFEFLYVTLLTAVYVLKIWFERDFDVLHVHNPPDTLFVAALIPRLAGKKLVYDHHDLAPELYLAKYEATGGILYESLKVLERCSCACAQLVVTVNTSYKASDAERNGKQARDIVVVRNGPPLSHLKPVPADGDLRKKATTLFGYLGHISQQDGVDHLIRALSHLSADHDYDDWFCIVIGPSEDFSLLQRLTCDLGLAEKIWFTGYLPDSEWRKLLATVDICIVPDPANPLNEKSTMIKFMEYMALGKPVVAYDLAENRVSGGDAALYAVPSQPQDMAACFYRLAKSEALRHTLGTEGRLRIREGLAWEFSAARLVEAYGHLTAKC